MIKKFILVTGTRRADREKHRDFVCEKIGEEFAGYNESEVEIIHGGAPGVDRMADRLAFLKGLNVRLFPYAHEFGMQGGHVRNGRMVRYLKRKREAGFDTVVLAFPAIYAESRGTEGCIATAELHGFTPLVYGLEV